MTFEIVFVLLSLLGMVAALIADKMRPGMILFSVVVLFLCAGILTPKEMLEGFSNKGMITVALLFLVSEGIRQSGTLGQVIKKLLPQGKTTVFKAQLRILPSVAFISAFLNNTPVVVIFAPIIKHWAKSVNLPATKFLIPLSYVTLYLTLCFTSLFTLMDPLGVMPVFLQMTDGMDTKERRCIALKACTIAFIILVLFTLSGRFLFHFFGISTNGFRIVGGIIIFKIGYDMLQAHFTHVKLNETERKEYSKDITITPLAIPMLCGPGAISSGITLMEDASEYTFKIVLLGVIALVCILSFFILCASTQLLKILGETGNNVMMRLMGLILMVIAVECFISGIRPVLIEILKQAHACS